MYDNGIVGNNVYTCHNYETLNNHFNSTQWNGQKKILNRWPSKKVIVPNVKNIKKIELSVAIESEIVNPRWHLFTFNCIVFCRDKHTTSLIYILWFTSYGSKNGYFTPKTVLIFEFYLFYRVRKDTDSECKFSNSDTSFKLHTRGYSVLSFIS